MHQQLKVEFAFYILDSISTDFDHLESMQTEMLSSSRQHCDIKWAQSENWKHMFGVKGNLKWQELEYSVQIA